MVPVKRKHVNKFRSAKKFRRHSKMTHRKNMQVGVARGGIRL